MRHPAPDIDAVTSLIEEAAQTIILPRFGQLSPEDVERKSSPSGPADVVTVADREAEAWLTDALTALVPSAPVIGEETVYRRPDLLRALESDGPLWLLDPIDGTKNFIRGDDRFGIMLAWVVAGRVRAAWVMLPARREAFVAEAGSGAFRNGQRLAPAPRPERRLRGSLHVRYMPDEVRETVLARAPAHTDAGPDKSCSATEYTAILRGASDFGVYYRLLPWDHAAPAFVLTEGGGCVDHLDGTPYAPRSGHQVTIVAGSRAVSDQVRERLTGG